MRPFEAWSDAEYVSTGVSAWRLLVQGSVEHRAATEAASVRRATARVSSVTSVWRALSDLDAPLTEPETVVRSANMTKQRRRLLADGRALLSLYASVVRAVALAPDSEFARRAKANDSANESSSSPPFIGNIFKN